MRAALRELPPADRLAVLMRAKGCDYDAIGAALSVPPATARKRVSRARARLKEVLDG